MIEQIHYWVFNARFDNDVDALIPEKWGIEALMVLDNTLLMGNLVHRDFKDMIAQEGDLIHVSRPSKMTATRSSMRSNVTTSDTTDTDVPIYLNQPWHTSFLLYDGDLSLAFDVLLERHLKRGLEALAQSLDLAVMGACYGFVGNSAGKLGTALTRTTLIQAQATMKNNSVPVGEPWNLVLSPNSEAELLDVDSLVEVNKSGSADAIVNALLGRKFKWDIYSSQNAPQPSGTCDNVTGAVDLVAGYAAGSTVLVVDGLSAAIEAGTWCTIAGDMTPQMITATSGGGTPVGLTLWPGLKHAVVNDAVITIYDPAHINLGAGYAANTPGAYTIDNLTNAPKLGQMATIGAVGLTAWKGSLIGPSELPTTTSALLSSPATSILADDAVIGLGPTGNFNAGFHREAIALVSRPLAPVRAGTGAISAVVNYNGLSIRVTISYDGLARASRVTVDLIAGVGLLDRNLGVLLYC